MNTSEHLQMKKNPLVSIISVNYAKADVTCELIESLKSITYPNYEIIIVDNLSEEDPSVISKKHPEVNLIKSEKNIGFAGANNLGISNAKGEFLLLLNNDTEVEPNFLEPLIEALQTNKKIGAVSPKVLYHNTNTIQYAGAKKVSPFSGRAFTSNYQEEDSGQTNVLKPTYYAFGGAMLIPKDIIKQIGPMPEVYFMYYEEIEWCEKIWNSGHQIYFVGNSIIYHKDSISLGKQSPLKTYYLNRNRILFLRRNTSLFHLFFSFFYLNLFVTPKEIFLYAFSGNLKHLHYYLKALIWNLTHAAKINP